MFNGCYAADEEAIAYGYFIIVQNLKWDLPIRLYQQQQQQLITKFKSVCVIRSVIVVHSKLYWMECVETITKRTVNETKTNEKKQRKLWPEK